LKYHFKKRKQSRFFGLKNVKTYSRTMAWSRSRWSFVYCSVFITWWREHG